MRVTVIIPNYNGEAFLPECLDSLLAQTRPADKVLVVDNGSRDRSRKLIRSHPLRPCLIELPENLGFAAAVNRGIQAANTEAVALLNNDATAEPDFIEQGLSALARWPEVSMFAALIVEYRDPSRIDHAGDLYLRSGKAHPRGKGKPSSDFNRPCEVWSACGAAAFFRRSLFEELGGFEESFFAYLEDVDFGFRARWKGHKCVFIPAAAVRHRGAATRLGPAGKARPEDSPERVFLITRNRVRVMARNWTSGMFFRFSPWVFGGFMKSALYHLLVSRSFPSFIRGFWHGLSRFPEDRKSFRKLMAELPQKTRKERLRDIYELMRKGTRPWAH